MIGLGHQTCQPIIEFSEMCLPLKPYCRPVNEFITFTSCLFLFLHAKQCHPEGHTPSLITTACILRIKRVSHRSLGNIQNGGWLLNPIPKRPGKRISFPTVETYSRYCSYYADIQQDISAGPSSVRAPCKNFCPVNLCVCDKSRWYVATLISDHTWHIVHLHEK